MHPVMLLSERRRKPELKEVLLYVQKVNKWAGLYSRGLLNECLLFLFCVYLGGDFSTTGAAMD